MRSILALLFACAVNDLDHDGYVDCAVLIDHSKDTAHINDGVISRNAPCGDCNDNDAQINPGASEQCEDGIDNDCDDEIDEGC